MLKDSNEQGLISLTVPPCCWNLQLIHYWEPYVNLTKGIRGRVSIAMQEIKVDNPWEDYYRYLLLSINLNGHTSAYFLPLVSRTAVPQYRQGIGSRSPPRYQNPWMFKLLI